MNGSGPANGRGAGRVMKLGRLLRATPTAQLTGSAATEVKGLAYDSRQVQPGFLFFALPGATTSGALFLDEAIRRGAAAVAGEPGLHVPKGLPVVQVAPLRPAMADLAAELYGHPSHTLRVIGITGTNGKTTSSFMVRDILRAAGTPTALIGTIHYEFGGRHLAAGRTTPEAPDVQRILAESLQAGEQALAMEVSSQGLAADRLRGTRFSAAIFTNLTPEHLDFHRTMEEYFHCKRRLFEELLDPAPDVPAVINLDDDFGRRLAEDPCLENRVLGYGLAAAAPVRAVDVRRSERGTGFTAVTPWGEARVELAVAGRFNVSNALAAMAVCGAWGVPPGRMAATLSAMPPVPGRLERIPDPKGGRFVFVDYAHSEDALRNVLGALRETFSGRLICVFGCGGNRDAGKRPRMGAVVSEGADQAVVTSDNPRNEDPSAIIEQIVAGMDPARPITVEPDRAAALRAALRETRQGDVLLVAGKGHETYQEIGGRMTPFDDRQVLRDALR